MVKPRRSLAGRHLWSAALRGLRGFWEVTDGSFVGAVVLTRIAPAGEGEFIAVNRVQHPGYGEDVNALPIP